MTSSDAIRPIYPNSELNAR